MQPAERFEDLLYMLGRDADALIRNTKSQRRAEPSRPNPDNRLTVRKRKLERIGEQPFDSLFDQCGIGANTAKGRFDLDVGISPLHLITEALENVCSRLIQVEFTEAAAACGQLSIIEQFLYHAVHPLRRGADTLSKVHTGRVKSRAVVFQKSARKTI